MAAQGQTRVRQAGRGRGRGKPTLPKPGNKAAQTSRPRRGKAHQPHTQWFHLAQHTIRSSTKTGALGEHLLHPQEFPGTPYYTTCVNHTHRIERSWQLQVHITSATFTGARVAVVPLNDPSVNQALMTTEMAWQQVANGKGAMVSSSGQTTRQFTIPIHGATRQLSNARPGDDINLLGYSTGMLYVMLLDSPIGLSAEAELIVTILGRVDVTPIGPFPGFIATENPAPTPAGDKITVTVPNVAQAASIAPWYQQGEYLDQGGYWTCYGLVGTTPTPSTAWSKMPDPHTIYVTHPLTTATWTGGSKTRVHAPTYFVVYTLATDGWWRMVGFTDLSAARLAASGRWTSESRYQEYSLEQEGFGETGPAWNERWMFTDPGQAVLEVIPLQTMQVTRAQNGSTGGTRATGFSRVYPLSQNGSRGGDEVNFAHEDAASASSCNLKTQVPSQQLLIDLEGLTLQPQPLQPTSSILEMPLGALHEMLRPSPKPRPKRSPLLTTTWS